MSVISLWDGAPPGTEDWTHDELPPEPFGDPPVTIVRNVVHPTMTGYAPERPNGTAAIVCPGGAYHFLAVEHEGRMVAEWLCERGVTAFVLKYRVLPTPVEDAGFKAALAKLFERSGLDRATQQLAPHLLRDGGRAVELAREHGDRVVMIGFSAGARVTYEAVRSSTPPDAAALVYAPPIAVESVASDAPPLFLIAANDDPLTTKGSTSVHDAWRAAGRPVELHLYERGGHGFGMNRQGLPVDGWIDRLGEWLGTRGLS